MNSISYRCISIHCSSSFSENQIEIVEEVNYATVTEKTRKKKKKKKAKESKTDIGESKNLFDCLNFVVVFFN